MNSIPFQSGIRFLEIHKSDGSFCERHRIADGDFMEVNLRNPVKCKKGDIIIAGIVGALETCSFDVTFDGELKALRVSTAATPMDDFWFMA